ncbi:MAG: thioredoxin family protein [Firmicutes bacterium]|nr:thioredoxin family protein [Bacillota bacterium]
MEKFFNDDIRKQITQILEQMVRPITIKLFVDEKGCQTCNETKQLLTEFKETSKKISLEILDKNQNPKEAEKYGITLLPSFVVLNDLGEYKGVKFNGIPAGHEINSFISALIEMSGHPLKIPQVALDRIAKINKPVNIKVFVTLSCPHCPGAVQNAHRLAMLNPNIKAEMIEANTFPGISQQYNVSGVPKIIINEKYELLGNQPLEAFLNEIEKSLRA